jgi:hypothetical protein
VEFRNYLAAVNGMLEEPLRDTDRNGYSFWPLTRLEHLAITCADNGIAIPQVPDVNEWIVFADYLQWSWGFAISCARMDDSVLQVGTDRGIIAKSFREFVKYYLADSQEIYPKRT